MDAPDDRLTVDRVADQVRVAQCRRRIVGSKDVWNRRARGRRTLLRTGFELHTRVHVVGWSGAQDQRPALARGHGVERPRRAAGTAGQGVEILDADLTEDRPKNLCQLLFHLRPKPNSRWATRRI